MSTRQKGLFPKKANVQVKKTEESLDKRKKRVTYDRKKVKRR
jgi:hypothetical protein